MFGDYFLRHLRDTKENNDYKAILLDKQQAEWFVLGLFYRAAPAPAFTLAQLYRASCQRCCPYYPS